jgi:hypothetical protein
VANPERKRGGTTTTPPRSRSGFTRIRPTIRLAPFRRVAIVLPLLKHGECDMRRLLVVGLLVVSLAGAAMAIDPPVQGKERTPIEHDLHLSERTTPETVPTHPTLRDDVVSALRAILFVQLGTVPLTPPVLW